jgi:CubicO group peptidase (beta-lactamase class C family)
VRGLLCASTCALALCCVSLPGQENPSWQSAVETSVREVGFHGAILVQSRGQIVLNKAFGGTPQQANPETRYWIASISKSFTATLILRLEERGALKRSDTLEKYFPEAPPDKKRITIEQLLTHTSGLPNKYISEGIIDRAEAVKRILALPLSHRPEEAFGYTNDGYSLLAAIAEVAAKARFPDLMKLEIFEPAGMTNSGLWPACPGPLPVLPLSVTLPPQMNRENWGYWGPDGVCSTTADLAKWMNALLGGKILAPASLQAMWKGEVGISDGEAAAGWFLSVSAEGSRVIYTRGTDHGHNSIVKYYPDKELIVISLSSSKDPEGPLLARILISALEKKLKL